MSRAEMYPWSLLTDVGDYFAVPANVKPYSYMSALVSQRNYRGNMGLKLTAVKTTYGTIVMVAQVGEEPPLYEFKTAEGILAISSKAAVRAQDHNTPLGERAVSPPRTQAEIVAQMSQEVKEANLPWWPDKRTGKILFNSKIATEEDLEKWYRGERLPDLYPDYYHLDENLIRQEPARDEDEDFFEVLEEGGTSDQHD